MIVKWQKKKTKKNKAHYYLVFAEFLRLLFLEKSRKHQLAKLDFWESSHQSYKTNRYSYPNTKSRLVSQK